MIQYYGQRTKMSMFLFLLEIIGWKWILKNCNALNSSHADNKTEMVDTSFREIMSITNLLQEFRNFLLTNVPLAQKL